MLPAPVSIEAYETETTGDGDETVVALVATFEDPPALLYSRRVIVPITQDITLPGYELIFDFNCN